MTMVRSSIGHILARAMQDEGVDCDTLGCPLTQQRQVIAVTVEAPP